MSPFPPNPSLWALGSMSFNLTCYLPLAVDGEIALVLNLVFTGILVLCRKPQSMKCLKQQHKWRCCCIRGTHNL